MTNTTNKPNMKREDQTRILIETKFTKDEQKKLNAEIERKRFSSFIVEWAYHERMWKYHYEMAKWFKKRMKWSVGLRNPKTGNENNL